MYYPICVLVHVSHRFLSQYLSGVLTTYPIHVYKKCWVHHETCPVRYKYIKSVGCIMKHIQYHITVYKKC